MDHVSADNLVQLVRTHMWIPVIATIVGAIIRISKSDPLVARIKLYIKPENRPIWAMVFAVALAALDRLATGGTWYDAIAGGLVAGSGAIAGHEIIVNKIRKGRDVGVKKEPPPPPNGWEDDSLRPPPAAGPKIMDMDWPPKLLGVLIVLTLALAACPGAGRIACPVIDLASQLCPVILVKMPDGTQEQVPKDGIEIAALRQRAARLKVEREARDAGAE